MITANGKKIFNFFSGVTSSAVAYNGVSKNISGNFAPIYALTGRDFTSPVNLLSLSSDYSTMDVGFENTPESESDYILADGNTANPLLTVVSYGKNTQALGDIFNVYANYRNNGNSNVVVKEIGFYGNLATNSSSAGSYTFLICRKVLETPVTIAPGETYSFNYVLRFKS